MNSNLFRLVYCSRNRILRNALEVTAEIESLLLKSRRNNAKRGVTGALLYNDGNFAQVLEGPVTCVGEIFEKIQRDPRHSEVTVVQSGFVENRHFPDWSMAFAGNSASAFVPEAQAAFDAAFARSESAGTRIHGLLQALVVQEDDWILVDS